MTDDHFEEKVQRCLLNFSEVIDFDRFGQGMNIDSLNITQIALQISEEFALDLYEILDRLRENRLHTVKDFEQHLREIVSECL